MRYLILAIAVSLTTFPTLVYAVVNVSFDALLWATAFACCGAGIHLTMIVTEARRDAKPD